MTDPHQTPKIAEIYEWTFKRGWGLTVQTGGYNYTKMKAIH